MTKAIQIPSFQSRQTRYTLLHSWSRTGYLNGGVNSLMSRDVYQTKSDPSRYMIHEDWSFAGQKAYACDAEFAGQFIGSVTAAEDGSYDVVIKLDGPIPTLAEESSEPPASIDHFSAEMSAIPSHKLWRLGPPDAVGNLKRVSPSAEFPLLGQWVEIPYGDVLESLDGILVEVVVPYPMGAADEREYKAAIGWHTPEGVYGNWHWYQCLCGCEVDYRQPGRYTRYRREGSK